MDDYTIGAAAMAWFAGKIDDPYIRDENGVGIRFKTNKELDSELAELNSGEIWNEFERKN